MPRDRTTWTPTGQHLRLPRWTGRSDRRPSAPGPRPAAGPDRGSEPASGKPGSLPELVLAKPEGVAPIIGQLAQEHGPRDSRQLRGGARRQATDLEQLHGRGQSKPGPDSFGGGVTAP